MPATVSVSVTPTSIPLQAGEAQQATVTLRNSGQSVDQFTVNIEGLDPTWYSLPVSSVALFPNDEDNLKIAFQLPKDGIRGGAYPFHLKVMSQENPAEPVTVDLSLQVEAVPEVELEIQQAAASGRKTHFRLDARNPGTSEATLSLKTATSDSRLKVSIAPRNLKVPGEGQGEAEIEASLGWTSLFLGKSEAEFQVSASVQGRSDVKTVTAQVAVVRWLEVLSQIRLPWLSRPPLIESFKATTDDRREFKLAWSTKRASDVRIDDEQINPRGERKVQPSEARTYVITATSRYGTVSRTVEVQPVTVPPASACERIRVTLPQNALKANAGGAPVPLAVQVQNMGQIVDKFTLDVEGVDNTWYTRSASSVALMPQATGQAQILFQPPKQKPVRSGSYPFAITVRSQSSPGDFTTVLGQLEVLPLLEFKAAVRPYRVTTRNKGAFRVALANTGVSEMTVDLEATDLDEGLRFRFKNDSRDESYVLPAWTSIEVPMEAKPKRGSLVGERKQYDITVTARGSDGRSQSAQCVLQHRPRMATWRPITRTIRILIGIGIIVTIVYFVLQWGGGWNTLTRSPQTFVNQLAKTIQGWFGR